MLFSTIFLLEAWVLWASVSEPHIWLFNGSSSVYLSVSPVWLTEHACKNNSCSLLCHASLPIIWACPNDQNRRRLRSREERPTTKMLDPTFATKNEVDREDSNRKRARLKRAWDGSDERMDQYVTVALSVRSSLLLAKKLIFTSPLLN